MSQKTRLTGGPQKRSRTSSRKQLPSHLSSSRYFFFGGKGGVGKTTAATATALLLLEFAKPSETILLFSTDPAHSLSDSLAKRIGNRLVQVEKKKRSQLVAFEMDSTVALEDFRKKHAGVLAEIAERGTLLDSADIKELLNLSLPGLDEVMALFELSELDRASKYSHIVIDTAPSGHTSRLLRLPEVFTRMLVALDRMADKHRYMVAHFARRRVVDDEVDLFLRDLNERIQRVRSLLYNRENSSFALVSIPEAMSVRETERYRDSLLAEGVSVTDLIINRVEEEHNGCNFCRARVVAQRPWLKKLESSFKDLHQHRVPLLTSDVRGIEALSQVGDKIWLSNASSGSSKTPVKRPSRAKPKPAQKSLSEFSLAGRRIWIFGGKGGVGKTTAAAAFALSLAKQYPKQEVLLFSTDPAHSLSDSFDETIGPLKKRAAGVRNLDAMEIDPGEWFVDLKRRYRAWTDSLFGSLMSNSRFDIQFDREAMRELVELTPPGIDEIAALGTISDLVDQNRYQTIVLDTAPTGHLLRFLELPQVALDWVRAFMKLLIKYQNVVHASRIAEELIGLSKSIKRVLTLLTDSKLCEFVGVAIPERMSLEETMDLARSLAKLKVPMQRLVINGLVPDDAAAGCAFCGARRAAQDQVMKTFDRQLGKSVRLFVSPQTNRDICGPDLLLRHFANWSSFHPSGGKPRQTLQTNRTTLENLPGKQVRNER